MQLNCIIVPINFEGNRRGACPRGKPDSFSCLKCFNIHAFRNEREMYCSDQSIEDVTLTRYPCPTQLEHDILLFSLRDTILKEFHIQRTDDDVPAKEEWFPVIVAILNDMDIVYNTGS